MAGFAHDAALLQAGHHLARHRAADTVVTSQFALDDSPVAEGGARDDLVDHLCVDLFPAGLAVKAVEQVGRDGQAFRHQRDFSVKVACHNEALRISLG